MAAAPFRVIRPFLRPPLTRYKPGGYLCPEWYRRARSTPVPCMGIQSTGSSTLLGQAVSFILRPRMWPPRPEFLIIHRTSTKVSEPPPSSSPTTASRNIRRTVEAAAFFLSLYRRWTLRRDRPPSIELDIARVARSRTDQRPPTRLMHFSVKSMFAKIDRKRRVAP